MAKYRIMKDGRHVEDVEGEDARQVGMDAIDRHGNGMYDVSLIRSAEYDERDCGVCGVPFTPAPGEDTEVCEDCLGDVEED